MNDGVNALEIDANHLVHCFSLIFSMASLPGSKRRHWPPQRPIGPSANREVHKFLVIRVTPNVGFERFHARAMLAAPAVLVRSVLSFVVVEDYVRAGLREELDRRSANPSRTPVMSAALPPVKSSSPVIRLVSKM